MSEQSSTFLDRLTVLARGRKLTPWLIELGWTTGDIGRINKGHVPGWEKLMILAESDGANLHWLITGQGDRYTRAHKVAAPAPQYVISPIDPALAKEIANLDEAGRKAVLAVARALRKGKKK